MAKKETHPGGVESIDRLPQGGRKRVGKDTPAARWRRMARLAEEALAALGESDFKQAREYVEAIRAVALSSAKSEGERSRA